MENRKLDIGDLKEASLIIDKQGIPRKYVKSKNYVVLEGKEYQLEYMVKLALELNDYDIQDFDPKDINVEYIESLGLKVHHYEDGYNFFTKEELEFYNSIVNTDYRKVNPEQMYYREKLYPIIVKTEYWAKQVIPDGFKLRKDGHWISGYVSKIKSYIWPRVYFAEDNDVFFNVEVNGKDRFIGFKLDGYYKTAKALSEDKIQYLDEYKELIDWEWIKIDFNSLKDYDWSRLVSETKDYIKKYMDDHDYLKEVFSEEIFDTEGQCESNKSKLCRLTWNTNRWVKPSGSKGKSKHLSFEKENGFGHEEWLFDRDKVIGGYMYGFLQPVNKYYKKYLGEKLDLALYTVNGDTKEKFWVTTLHNVEVIDAQEADNVLEVYKKEGWYNEMKADLLNLNLNSKQLDLWIQEGAEKLFNIKFKASEISKMPNELIPISDKNIISANRYILLNTKKSVLDKIEEETKKNFSFEDSGNTNVDLLSKGKRNSIGRDIELEYKHNVIQSIFLKYLQSKHGETNVKRECNAYGAARIDIARKTQTGYVFYEIKTYNNLKTSIREGIGQLLEYSLYPNVVEAEQLVLVSDIYPNKEIQEYFSHLREFINIPISYICFDVDKEDVTVEI